MFRFLDEKLISDWCLVMKRAWSFRLAIVTGVLTGIEVFLPLFSDAMPRGIFAAAATITSTLAAISRVIPQSNLDEAA